jgi:hypothetical protein
MKNILERFEKLAAVHQLNADCAAAMRGLLQAAHTAGFSAHMDLAEAAHANEDEEQDALPVAAREEEPDDDEETTERMVKAVRKEIRKNLKKEVRKAVRKHLQRIAPLAQ